MNYLKSIIIISLFTAVSVNTHAQESTITVFGACGMCKDRIEQAAMKVAGVKSAEYNLTEQTLTVNHKSSFDVNELHLAMTKVGHDTDALRALDEVYDALHDCCHYRVETEPANSKGESTNSSVESSFKVSKFITGHIYELDDEGEKLPLIGANIVWAGAPTGAVTDESGSFEIGRIESTDLLVISYVGYRSDSIDMSDQNTLDLVLNNDLVLEEINVVHRKNTSEVSMLAPIHTVNIGEEELCKAACCNLSESFETSPAVDVSFTDAVTGTRQIQMLGLAGKYVQITRELIPDIRGLSSIYGLTYTPGAWIQSMQLSKGTGSVVNGHESMTGQINVELRKPVAEDKMYLNLYANEGGRYEGNLITRHKFSPHVSTAILLHGSTRDRKFDRNEDGFLDSPLAKDVIFVNRWKYQHQNGWQGQLGFKLSHIDRSSGQIDFDANHDELSSDIWGTTNETRRYEGWMKIGKILSKEKNRSIGFQLSGVQHDQSLTFGTRAYEADQQNLFANLIFQSDLESEAHVLKFGVNTVIDQYDESFDNLAFPREEITYGAFSEYTWKATDLITIVGGIRGDVHNTYGFMLTPRAHIRMAMDETFNSVFRIIAGKGWRTANVLAENVGVMASSRNLSILGTESNTPYALRPEQAWNFGLNFTQTLRAWGRQGTFGIDYYYTMFEDQIVLDVESSGDGSALLYNQEKQTDGHSVQTQIDFEILPRLDLRTAYRYNYSTAYFGDENKTLPFSSFHRAFVNLAYETKGNWHFDVTANWRGPQRIPDSGWLDVEDQLDEMSPAFVTVNAQIRKVYDTGFEWYIGGENITNFTQDNPIINAETPFSNDFDASQIWGPIFGRNIYAGLRYRLK